MIPTRLMPLGRGGKRVWANPYPKDGLAFTWSENSGDSIDKTTLFSTLVALFNSKTAMSISLATKGLSVTSGDSLLIVNDTSYVWAGAFRLSARNAGSAGSPSQRPYMICDGNSDFSNWGTPMRMLGVSVSSDKIDRFLNRTKNWSVSHSWSTKTAVTGGATFNTDKVSSIVVYDKALTVAEMRAIYDIHKQEFGWQS